MSCFTNIVLIFSVSFQFWLEGTVLTASAHIITAVIGSGVLSLAWAMAQLGWVAGPVILFLFSFITYFTSTLLTDCYRFPGPDSGKRNYSYMEVVRSHLGNKLLSYLTHIYWQYTHIQYLYESWSVLLVECEFKNILYISSFIFRESN